MKLTHIVNQVPVVVMLILPARVPSPTPSTTSGGWWWSARFRSLSWPATNRSVFLSFFSFVKRKVFNSLRKLNELLQIEMFCKTVKDHLKEILQQKYYSRNPVVEILQQKFRTRNSAVEIPQQKFCSRNPALEITQQKFCSRNSAVEILREMLCIGLCHVLV